MEWPANQGGSLHSSAPELSVLHPGGLVENQGRSRSAQCALCSESPHRALELFLQPEIVLDALVQYDFDQKVRNTNIRFNFIHRPLSDLYVVYNEQAFETPEAPAAGRSLVVKFTRMVSF